MSKIPWSMFGTFTFDRKVGPTVALHAIERWIGNVDRVVRVETRVRAGWPGVGYVVGLEQHTDHVSPHGHALLVGTDGIYLAPHWQRWAEEEGRGKFEQVRSDTAVAFYCSKYATKDQSREPEFTVSRNLGAWLSSGSVRRVELYSRQDRGRRGRVETGDNRRGFVGATRAEDMGPVRVLVEEGKTLEEPRVSGGWKVEERRSDRVPAVRSLGFHAEGPGDDVVREASSRETALPARRWWHESSPGRWTFAERTVKGTVRDLAHAWRDLSGYVFGQRVDVAGSGVRTYGDLPSARLGIEGEVLLGKAGDTCA